MSSFRIKLNKTFYSRHIFFSHINTRFSYTKISLILNFILIKSENENYHNRTFEDSDRLKHKQNNHEKLIEKARRMFCYWNFSQPFN
jgi:hypothetical protein